MREPRLGGSFKLIGRSHGDSQQHGDHRHCPLCDRRSARGILNNMEIIAVLQAGRVQPLIVEPFLGSPKTWPSVDNVMLARP